MTKNYIYLGDLIVSWSEQSGELDEVILTNLADQDKRGRFPAGTFRLRSTGDPSRPGDLWALVTKMRTSSYDYQRREAAEKLFEVVVSKAGIVEYCDEFDVRPPRCVVGFWKWFSRRSASFAAPPQYPATEEELEELARCIERERKAACDAQQKRLNLATEAMLLQLENILADFERDAARGAPYAKYAWAFEYEDQWHDACKQIDEHISKISDEHIAESFRNRLRGLEDSLEILRETVAVDSTAMGDAEKRGSAFSEAKVRQYLEEQVRRGNRRTRLEHFNEVRARHGPHISERAYNRIRSEVVPPEWRKPGRPPARKESRDTPTGENTAPEEPIPAPGPRKMAR